MKLTTHNGTHLDAPWHCHSTMNKGERSMTIDEVPLEWCFQPAVERDFRDRPERYASAGWTRAAAIFDDALLETRPCTSNNST